MSVLMKGFSAQLQCPTSLGNVEAVNQSLLGRVLWNLRTQDATAIEPPTFGLQG